jgi:Flp pilus assembly pilin Flp
MDNFLLEFHLAARSLIRRDDGQDLIEYGLAVSLIALICVAGMNTLATSVSGLFQHIDSHLFRN